MKKTVFWIIAGTTEGRELIDLLRNTETEIYVSVATEYGKNLIDPSEQVHIRAGRMEEREMIAWIQQIHPDHVIDTTHPYAKVVTENIARACQVTGTPYLRIVRECKSSHVRENGFEGTLLDSEIFYAENSAHAAELLSHTTGNIFLTCGSKEIEAFTVLEGYRDRVFARVLPMPDVIEKCQSLGFRSANISYMQGPFSKNLNLAMMQACNARYMVTKDSGETGGFQEKMAAAWELGVTPVVIGRPPQVDGITLEEASRILCERYRLDPVDCSDQDDDLAYPYFPLFLSLKGKEVFVIGAGKIARRRIAALLPFQSRIKVIAPSAEEEILEWMEAGMLQLEHRTYQPGDCRGAAIVVAATDDPAVNVMIAEECNSNGILVSTADDRHHCTFYFPAVVTRGNLVIGITSSGEDHSLVKKIAEMIRRIEVSYDNTKDPNRQQRQQTGSNPDSVHHGTDQETSS